MAAADSSYSQDILAWRRQLEDSLRRRDGWLALAGLHWLDSARTTAGSDPECDLVLPDHAPPRFGVFEVTGSEVTFHPGTPRTAIEGLPPEGSPLQPDTADRADRIRHGDLSLALIERGGRLGIRIWDNARPERTDFSGRRWFPIDPGYRVEAVFEPADPGRTIAIPNQLGDLVEGPELGRAVFELAGAQLALRAVPYDQDRLWFLFEDLTNGDTTYPAGRFLIAEPPAIGSVVLDFNRAYNPPCAFTAFATCPLPPDGNRLAVAIEAGEQVADDFGPHLA